MSPEPWDPGLQSERTRLAWVRTAMALAAGGLGIGGVAARGGLHLAAVGAFLLGAFFGGILLARTGRRYEKVQQALHRGRPLDDQADAILAWLGVLAVAAGAVTFVLTR
jgi:uncharacterized membrane protein YidH (DUF202 family)